MRPGGAGELKGEYPNPPVMTSLTGRWSRSEPEMQNIPMRALSGPRTASLRDLFSAEIHMTVGPVMKFQGLAGPLPWEELRKTRKDIPEEDWKRTLKAADGVYRKAKAAWDAEHIPGGTSEEIEMANYDGHPSFMSYLRLAIEILDKEKS